MSDEAVIRVLVVVLSVYLAVVMSCVERDAVKVTPEVAVASPKPVAVSEPTVAVQGQSNDTRVVTTTKIGDELVGRILAVGMVLLVLSYSVGKILWIIFAWGLGRTFARTRKRKNVKLSRNFCGENLPVQ